LDGGSTRNVNINIIRGGGGGFGGSSPRAPPSPARIASDATDQVNAIQAQVAQQMSRANDELRAQRQRADDLVKAQVRLRTLAVPFPTFHTFLQELIKKQLATAVAVAAQQAAALSNMQVMHH
jgi:hypothetical protein